MNYLPEDLEHVASESSQQDWNDIRFAEVYRKAFIEGGRYVGHYADLEIEQLQARGVELEQREAALTAHLARLKSVCELALDNHNKTLMTDPPQCAWKYNQVTARLVEAIAATPETILAERDAEVARKAIIETLTNLPAANFTWYSEDIKAVANEYAERVKRGDV